MLLLHSSVISELPLALLTPVVEETARHHSFRAPLSTIIGFKAASSSAIRQSSSVVVEQKLQVTGLVGAGGVMLPLAPEVRPQYRSVMFRYVSIRCCIMLLITREWD
jgi:hypothetical protein